MLELIKDISLPLLVSLGVNDAPVYNYSYLATTEYGEKQAISGTHFYKPVLPELNAQFYFTQGKRLSYLVGFGSGFKSEKYTREPTITAKIFYDVLKNKDFKFTLFAKFLVGGGVY